jgi:glycosyltransferase involved in cell wall biosynthesis
VNLYESTSDLVYPRIDPVPAGIDRPFWSVMIPVYNGADYLKATLRSVLSQLAPSDDAQIEVVDDCSTADDPAGVVCEYGEGRVGYFRQAANVGPQANFTTCIARARGQWVHILHADDMVGKGFYATFKAAATVHETIGAALCRSIIVDASGAALYLSDLEAETAGLLTDFIDRLAVDNLIRFPSIAVKRSVYERIGGFHPQLFHSADWDMWKRVALTAPVWYEPEPMVMYRTHDHSDTSRLIRSGANIADARHAINIAWHYLPSDRRDHLSRRARDYHAHYALELAADLIRQGEWGSALAQVREALGCSADASVVVGAMRLAGPASRRLLERAGREYTSDARATSL